MALAAERAGVKTLVGFSYIMNPATQLARQMIEAGEIGDVIRANTIAYDDYIAFNGETGAKDAGKARDEGKEYVVQDGDVIHFRGTHNEDYLMGPASPMNWRLKAK